MKAYIITATIEDSNGVRVSSNNAETLGNAYGVTYLTRESAETEAEALEYESAEYDVEEVDFTGFVEGNKYDVKSVCDAGFTIDEAGYQIGDYFCEGRYLGPCEAGIEPSMTN